MLTTPLKKFYDTLEEFDWFYAFSEEYKDYKNGRKKEKKLEEMASQSQEHLLLYRQYKAYVFSGFGGISIEKPERPV